MAGLGHRNLISVIQPQGVAGCSRLGSEMCRGDVDQSLTGGTCECCLLHSRPTVGPVTKSEDQRLCGYVGVKAGSCMFLFISSL